MQSYVIHRASSAALVLFLASVVIFFVLRVLPRDEFRYYAGERCPSLCPSAEESAWFRERYDLDDPYPVQYFKWVGHTLRGDLGRSYVTGNSIHEEIGERLPYTLQLLAFALLFTIIIGFSLGLLSAVLGSSLLDYLSGAIGILSLSIPYLFLAVLVLMIPGHWGYWPPYGQTSLVHDTWRSLREFVPPSLVLALAPSSVLGRTTRAAFADVMRRDYIRVAQSKGLTGRAVIMGHALRNVAIPTVLVIPGLMPFLFGATIIIEYIFTIPGLGLYLYASLLERDFVAAQTVVACVAVIIVVVNSVADVACVRLDPRLMSTRAMVDGRARDVVLRGSTVIH